MAYGNPNRYKRTRWKRPCDYCQKQDTEKQEWHNYYFCKGERCEREFRGRMQRRCSFNGS